MPEEFLQGVMVGRWYQQNEFTERLRFRSMICYFWNMKYVLTNKENYIKVGFIKAPTKQAKSAICFHGQHLQKEIKKYYCQWILLLHVASDQWTLTPDVSHSIGLFSIFGRLKKERVSSNVRVGEATRHREVWSSLVRVSSSAHWWRSERKKTDENYVSFF